LAIRSLTSRNFRNLEPTTVHFGERTNLVLGANGEGKTNLLEALAMLCNLRSFRTARLAAVIRHGAGAFRLEGEFEGGAGPYRLEQVVQLGPPRRRQLKISGSPVSVERYLAQSPVVALSADDTALVDGPPSQRRVFIDRLAFLLEAGTLGDVRSYRRTLRQRNAALESGRSDDELEVWDARLAEAASRVVARRTEAVERLRGGFEQAYRNLASEGFPTMSISYRSERWLNPSQTIEELEESYRKRYNMTRVRDRHAGHTQDGPHRHDLRLEADGRPVKDALSSGQTKIVAAALRLATVAQVERDRDEHPPVIIDDVDAELDSTVFSRLTRSLANDRQLFLSSAHGELVAPVFPGAHVLTVERGGCRAESK
jgi:DNA replication and repair protein RecF